MRRRPALTLAAAVLAVLGTISLTGASASTAPDPIARYVPPIGHVFVINIENKGYDATWGPTSKAPYLAKTLRSPACC